jgi:hypothetical protein
LPKFSNIVSRLMVSRGYLLQIVRSTHRITDSTNKGQALKPLLIEKDTKITAFFKSNKLLSKPRIWFT